MLSPAKINLGLRVIGKRPDGFHDIETLFQEISLTDRIEFHESSNWEFEVLGADLDSGSRNLVTRAADALSAAAGRAKCGHVRLIKEIPIGGGLGGGSSNASVALIGLSKLWNLHWKREPLLEIAANLGSDCPFFLYGGLVQGTGRGEVLVPMDGCLAGYLVIVTPTFGIQSSWAYKSIRLPLTNREKTTKLMFCPKAGNPPDQSRDIPSNDLEYIVLVEYRELSEVKRKLEKLGAEASMLSGSGSSVFGVFPNRLRAVHAAQQFGAEYTVHICQAVSRPRLPVEK